ncbi:hypothetical protein HPB52_021088 [Rhipicephalus sanguineus]|uniref:Uncharacterized protein n=1 Tax=Rhipicephalus sanguineus TaxID=34632 RepID=A0A9D4PYS1_RHISA|nr:hypothetical protein HPB52_021088 [Rhipicephalus sanguineus]
MHAASFVVVISAFHMEAGRTSSPTSGRKSTSALFTAKKSNSSWDNSSAKKMVTVTLSVLSACSTGFLLEHNIPLTAADHVGPLFGKMFPASDIARRFTGADEKRMEGVRTTLKDGQVALLRIFLRDTILVGYSLDSDLRALLIIHDTVADTS